MYSQAAVIVGLVCTTLAYPKTFQEQRQLVYSQALPLDPYQIPQQQIIQFQLPASTSFIPNNVPGVRYGEQQVVYLVPGGGQVVYKEGQATQPNQPYVDSLVNFLNGRLQSSAVDSRLIAQAPTAEKQAADETAEKLVEKTAEPQAPAHDEQTSTVEEAHLADAAKQQQLAYASQPQLQAQAQAPAAAQIPAQAANVPVQLSQGSAQQYQVQQLPYQPLSPQEQNLLQQRLFFLSQPQQALYSRPELASPTANYLYNYRTYPLSDKKPGHSAIAFQKLLQKHAEATAAATNNTEAGESTDSESTNSDEIGPSIAQAKPQAVSVAGPGGVAAAAPVGTAIVGPGGMALSAPTATAIAGTKPKPSDKTKSAYLSRTNLFPF